MSAGRPPINIQSVCSAHAEGRLQPRLRAHVLRQLEAEGHKRAESFLFEPIFVRQLVQCFGENNVALGWQVQRDNRDLPRYWFKHGVVGEAWNACDQRVADFLVNAGCQVVLVEYDDGTGDFIARHYASGGFSPAVPLVTALSQLSGRGNPVQPRNFSYINQSAQRLAITMIDRVFSDGELTRLSLTRILTNCYIYPRFAQQPMDIDACCLVDDQLRIVEFKRKYPAYGVRFGIDDKPHGALADWLATAGNPLVHIILCDPLWNASESPTHLLANPSPTAQYAVWLGVILRPQAFTGGSLRTSGADSGMTGGE